MVFMVEFCGVGFNEMCVWFGWICSVVCVVVCGVFYVLWMGVEGYGWGLCVLCS